MPLTARPARPDPDTGPSGYHAFAPSVGSSTSRIEQILSKLDSELPLAPRISHQVHALRRLAGSGSEVDAIVVLEALEVPGSMILSSDAGDMHALLAAAGSGGRVPVLRV